MNGTQEKRDENVVERYLPIKNLSQLKRAFKEGRKFRIIKHYIKPEYSGQLRVPVQVQTNAFYSKVVDNPSHVLNGANGGKGSYLAFGKASDWRFREDGTCTMMRHGGHPIWEIGVLI